MLKSFRNASNSWFIKILFGAIIFSFVFFGIGDIIKNYSASQHVINVNKTSITSESFAKEYNQIRQKIRNSGEKALTDAQMKELDIKNMVLENLTNKAVIEQTMLNNKIIVPKKTVLSIIESIPEFQNNGIFDGRVYANVLQRSGMNEPDFVGNIKQNVERTQLFHPLTAGYKVPVFVKDIMSKEFEIEKTLIVGLVKVDDMKLVSKVENDDALEYYNSNIAAYKKPESRDISVLVIDYSNFNGNIVVTDQEVNSYYETNKSMFAPKESRTFERFIFSNLIDADKAWEMMVKGSSSKEIVTKLTPKLDTLDDMERHSFQKEIGDELFDSLKKRDEVSKVHQVGEQYMVYRLKKIDIIDKKTREQINKEIKDIIQSEKANSPEFYQKIKETKNKIDDGFGSGKTIEQISKETGMKIVTINDITKESKNLEIENLIKDDATRAEFVDAIFKNDEKQASAMIESHENDTLSFVVYVNRVKKEHVQDFKTISEKVKGDCIKKKKDELAKEKVDEIIEQAEKSIDGISKLNGVKTYSMSRKDVLMYGQEKSKNVTELMKVIPNQNVIMDILSTLKVGQSRYFLTADGNYLLVGMKAKASPKESDVKFDNIITKYVNAGASNDMSSIALNAFKTQLKIKIDHKMLDKITTSADADDAN